MNRLPFLVAGNVKSKERKVLQQAVQEDTRYGLSIENGGWYEPCYVVRYLGEFIAFSNDIEYIAKKAKQHKFGEDF